MTGATRGGTNLMWALVALGFGLLGLTGAYVLRERPTVAAQPTAAPVAGDAAILQLVEEVRLLREAIEQRPAATLPALRQPVTPSSEAPSSPVSFLTDEQFREAQKQLALLSSTLFSQADAAATPVQLPGADFQALPFPAREEVSTQEFSKRHIFWSYQQVVDAYGVPDEISTNPHGSQIWVYDDGDADLEFVFRDGFVLRVEW